MEKRFFQLIQINVFFILTFLLAGCQKPSPPFVCSDPLGCVDIKPGDPIELGMMQALSGGAVVIGEVQKKAMELAIALRGNQTAGHTIRLHVEDSQCSPEGGTNAALKFTTRKQIVAVLGPTCSSAAKEASEIISDAGLVMIAGTTSAPSLTSVMGIKGADWYPGFFRTMYSDKERGWALATYAYRELGVTRVATINDGDLYTTGFTDMFKKVFTELGGEVVLGTTINKGEKDMKPVLTAIGAHKAELVFFPIFQPEGGILIQQARELPELNHMIFVGVESLMVDNFIEIFGLAGADVYFVASHKLEGQMNDELVAAYKDKYGDYPQHRAYGYAFDAANLLLNTIESVAIKEKDGTLHIGRQALRDALYATSEFPGVTGTLFCDRFGDCGIGKFDILQLVDKASGVVAEVIYTYTAAQNRKQQPRE